MLRIVLLIALAFLADPASAGNFVVHAPSANEAQILADRAEELRHELAVNWFGKALEPWDQPCSLRWNPANGSSGVTRYEMGRTPQNMRMEVNGTFDEVLSNVLPHEVMHLVFAHTIGRSPPRWVDEGLCSNVESINVIQRLDYTVRQCLYEQRGIPTNHLMRMTDYPADVQAFYAQASSMVRFLLWKGGPQTLARVAGTTAAQASDVARMYAFESTADMQDKWLDWVREGSPEIPESARVMQFPTCGPSGCSPAPRGVQMGQPMRQQPMQSTPYVPDTAKPRPTSPVSVPPTTLPATAPPSGPGCDCDGLVEKIAALLELEAKPGPAGPKGDAGPAGSITQKQLDSIVAAVVIELRGDLSLRGPKGEPGEITDAQLEIVKQEVLASIPPNNRRVLLVDGSKGQILDDETYGPDEPIVLDVQKIMNRAAAAQ